MAQSNVILALDFNREYDVLNLVDRLSPVNCRLKVGKELFTACGPAIVKSLVDRGFDVFLDLKYHDIPNTVASALKSARDLGVWMVNVHASGGPRMMEAARAALSDAASPILIAVTVLTSMTEDDLSAIGIKCPVEDLILRLAWLAKSTGFDGVVCSARETMLLRKEFGRGFCLVTPGIRPAGSAPDDQMRIVSPVEAVKMGSDYLVIGRPVTRSEDPAASLLAINNSLREFCQ